MASLILCTQTDWSGPLAPALASSHVSALALTHSCGKQGSRLSERTHEVTVHRLLLSNSLGIWRAVSPAQKVAICGLLEKSNVLERLLRGMHQWTVNSSMSLVRNLSSRVASLTSVRAIGGLGEPGCGAGRSGGSGGSIRDAGGAFGRLEAAHEDEYFYKLQKTQIQGLRDQLKLEMDQHEAQMKKHREVLAMHEKRIADLEKTEAPIAKYMAAPYMTGP